MTTSGHPFTKSGKHGPSNKRVVVSLISGGKARAFNLSSGMTAKGVRAALVTNVYRQSDLMTDESALYTKVGKEFTTHKTVYHSGGVYVDKDGNNTNTVEGFFSIFKRGMKGVYQHCAERHLQRYLDEFSFRYTYRGITDTERTSLALRGAEGKRLMYHESREIN